MAISTVWVGAIGHSLWISLYVQWVGLLFAAVYRAGKVFPIAGAGLAAKVWQENTASILISIGAMGSAGAVLARLSLWSWAH